MKHGILAGLTWGADTVILGIALAMSPFCSTDRAVFLAPFVSTFLHDLSSAIGMATYMGVKGQLPAVGRALKTKSGKWVILAATIGGPIGMTGYVMTVHYMTASIGSIATAIFPAIGAVCAYFFLKERMRWYQWCALLFAIVGVLGLSYTPGGTISNFWLGLLGAMMCSFGWGIEAVIVAHGLKDPEMTDECALMIRQTTSATIYGAIIIPVLKGWGFTAGLFSTGGLLVPIIFGAAIVGTASYVFYYRAISTIGAAKSMALNIAYVVWAMLFTVVFLRDTSAISIVSVICAVLVMAGSIFAAADVRMLVDKVES